MSAIDTAINNFSEKAKRGAYRIPLPSFTNPNSTRGYGAVLKLLSNGSQPSRAAILEKIGCPTSSGYYSEVFTRLKWSKLISYDRANGYSLTQLGKDFIAESGLDGAAAYVKHEDSKTPGDYVSLNATSTYYASCMNAYNAAMDAYKAAMDVYNATMASLL